MSGLYNALFGMNPIADHLLGLLGLTRGDVGRFRDCYLEKRDEDLLITIFTRNGGGNREEYTLVFEVLRQHPLFVEDADAEMDSTYAYIRFKVPEEHLAIMRRVYERQGERDPEKAFSDVLTALQTGKKPEEVEDVRTQEAVERAQAFGEEVLKPAIESLMKTDLDPEEGGMDLGDIRPA